MALTVAVLYSCVSLLRQGSIQQFSTLLKGSLPPNPDRLPNVDDKLNGNGRPGHCDVCKFKVTRSQNRILPAPYCTVIPGGAVLADLLLLIVQLDASGAVASRK